MQTYCDGLSGAEIFTASEEAIADCSASGPVDDAVAYWVSRVEWHADAQTIRESLAECGAWDVRQLADDDENRQRILWVGACDLREASQC